MTLAPRLLALMLLTLASGWAQAAESVRVRVGAHPDHTRIVVDWPGVDYQVARDGDVWRVRFNRAANLDLGALAKSRAPLLVKATQRPGDAGVTLELQVEPDTGVSHRRLDGRVVLDLARTAKAKPAPEAVNRTKPEAKATAEVAGKEKPEPAELKALIERAAFPPVPLPEPKPAPPAAQAEQAVAAAPTPTSPAPPPDAVPAPAAPAPVAAVAPPPAPPPSPSPASPTPAAVAPAPPALVERLSLIVEGSGDTARLVFPWTEPVAAAAFTRGEDLWLVFDRPARLELGAIGPSRTSLILRADQVPMAGGTALRISTKGPRAPVLLRRQAAWVVGLADAGTQPALPIPLRVEPGAPGGARLLLAAGETGRRFTLTDPDSGDALQVVTLPQPGQGVAQARDYLEFRLLATGQGVAIAAKTERIEARPATGGVEIVAPEGLMLGLAPDPQETKLAAATVLRPALFTYDKWRGPGENFAKQKQALQHAIVDAAPGDRDQARLALAGFYFSHGYAQDTLAIMSLAGKDEPGIKSKPQFVALRGAALLLAGRTAEAAADLAQAKLDGRPEVALWRGLLAQAIDQPEIARREFHFGAGALPFYPAEARVRFNLAKLDAALATRDTRAAEQALAAVDRDRPDQRSAAETELRRAQVMEASGRPVDALSAYDRVAAMEWRATRARAEFARVNLMRTQDQLDPKSYIERLESMRFAWRGDAFEVEMRRRLVQAYVDVGDFRNAFTTLRQLAARQVKDSDTAKLLDNDLRALFVDMFLGPAAGKVSPISALALYQQNSDLAPSGAPGQEIAARLADRLIEVDLLDRAVTLVRANAEAQTDANLKARGLTRVATLQLSNRDPTAALATLARSESGAIGSGLAARRRLLKVQALIELGRNDEALGALEGATDRPAREIRAELLWRGQRWGAAATAYLELLSGKATGEAALDESERRNLLQAAIALVQAGDRQAIQRLRRDWSAKLDGTSEAETFRVLTDRPDPDGATFRQLAEQVAGAGDLQKMLAQYRVKPQS